METPPIKLYLISGLGADERVFDRLSFPAGIEVIPLPWIKPFRNESLSSYAVRLGSSIDLQHPFCLIGLSLGGIMISELVKTMNPLHAIIISSVKSDKELPAYFSIIRNLKLYKFLPVRIFKIPTIFSFWLFGIKTKDEKKLFRQILKDTDPWFLNWAIKAVLNWKNPTPSKEIIHLHGTNDKIFPIGNTEPTIVIKDGSHFMVFSMANQLNIELAKILKF
jgi:hypothetical protein